MARQHAAHANGQASGSHSQGSKTVSVPIPQRTWCVHFCGRPANGPRPNGQLHRRAAFTADAGRQESPQVVPALYAVQVKVQTPGGIQRDAARKDRGNDIR